MHFNIGRKRPDLSERNFKHGGHGTKLYRIWKSFRNRCTNLNHSKYKNYGGRGISYDPLWDNYSEFKKQMKIKWIQAKRKYGKDCLSIERLNVNGNYCFDNCIFIPISEQSENKVIKSLYKCFSPSGKIHLVTNLKKFARNNDLNPTHCYNVVHGQRNYHKGWKFDLLLRNYNE